MIDELVDEVTPATEAEAPEAGAALLRRLDEVTRARLASASETLDAVESLVAEGGGASSLDPAMARELRARGAELVEWLVELQRRKVVASCEESQLAVRRLERSLAVAIDLLPVPHDEERAPTPVEEELARRRQRRRSKTKKQAAAQRERRWARSRRTDAKRAAARRRIAVIGSVALMATALTVAWNGLGNASAPVVKNGRPALDLQPRAHLEDARLFLPAADTMLQGTTLHVMVDPDWRSKPEAERREAAAAAHTYFLNRAIPRLVIHWSDGRPIASFDRERVSWHEATGDETGHAEPSESVFALPE